MHVRPSVGRISCKSTAVDSVRRIIFPDPTETTQPRRNISNLSNNWASHTHTHTTRHTNGVSDVFCKQGVG